MEINELFCLGCNKYGQSGAGRRYHNKIFTELKSIVFPTFIKQVVCGVNHSAILTIDGFVYAMGSNMHATLAQPSSGLHYSYSPILVKNLVDISKISSGAYHMCAIDSENKLYSWGKGLDGQLGTGTYTNSHFPTLIQSFSDQVESVSCGANHTLVKTANQKCYSFGNGIYGQLGVGSNKNYNEPTQVKIQSVDQIAAGQNYSLFLKNGKVYGTGDNSKTQISNKIKKKCLLQPINIQFLQNITMIRANKLSIALSQSQNLYIWGSINYNSKSYQLQTKQYNILDIKTGGQNISFSTSDGKLFNIKIQNDQLIPIDKNINSQTILDFAIGQKHSIILGGIIGQLNQSHQILETLYTIQQLELQKLQQEQKQLKSLKKSNNNSSNNSNSFNRNSSLKSIVCQQQQQYQQSQAGTLKSSQYSSINSQHLSRTPSSIQRQPSTFRRKINQQNNQNDNQNDNQTSNKIMVTDFNKSNKQLIINISKSVNNFGNYVQENDDQRSNKSNNNSNKSEYSECMKKIGEVMNILDKNSRIQQNMQNMTSRVQLSRKGTRRNLNNKSSRILQQSSVVDNKENALINISLKSKKSSQKSNSRQLIMQLREKQLKISQLQEKLSRRQIEIECQKKVIDLLRGIKNEGKD